MSSNPRRIPVLEQFDKRLRGRPFVPHRLLGNAHFQTGLAATWKRSFAWGCPQSRPLVFETAGGISIRAETGIVAAGRPTLVAIHGVGGASDAPYMQGLLHKSWRAGWNAVLLNLYDVNLDTRPPAIFHSGSSRPLGGVLEAVSKLPWCGPLYVFAVSMGANMLLKLLGERGRADGPDLRAAAVISPLVDLMASWKTLDRLTNRHYRWHFIRGLKRVVREHGTHLQPFIQVEKFPAIRTIREFDELFTAPLGGFEDAFDYYRKASAMPWLGRVRLPSLLLHSLSDPILPWHPLCDWTVQQNPFLLTRLTRSGGHVGFIEQHRRDIDRYWAENRVMDFFRFVHDRTAH